MCAFVVCIMMSLPQGAIGWPVIYDCGISYPYSFAIFHKVENDVQHKCYANK